MRIFWDLRSASMSLAKSTTVAQRPDSGCGSDRSCRFMYSGLNVKCIRLGMRACPLQPLLKRQTLGAKESSNKGRTGHRLASYLHASRVRAGRNGFLCLLSRGTGKDFSVPCNFNLRMSLVQSCSFSRLAQEFGIAVSQVLKISDTGPCAITDASALLIPPFPIC